MVVGDGVMAQIFSPQEQEPSCCPHHALAPFVWLQLACLLAGSGARVQVGPGFPSHSSVLWEEQPQVALEPQETLEGQLPPARRSWWGSQVERGWKTKWELLVSLVILFFFFNLFYWSIPELQHCVNFHCIAKWFSYTHTYVYILFHISSVQSCPILWDPMDCSMPSFPVLHYLLELAQPHVH